jgi:RNA polymerase sigma-70 factor, ECF subfamily
MAVEQPEIESVQQAIAGDKGALTLLLMRHNVRLTEFIEKSFPGYVRSHLSVDDVRQISWEQAFQAIGGFEPRGEGSFFAWMRTIADHRVKDAVRQHQRHQSVFAAAQNDASAGCLPEPAADSSTPSQKVGNVERLDRLRQAMQSLPQDYRTVLELRFLNGLSVAQTAQRMGRSCGAVCMMTSRAMDEMHVIMGSTGNYFSRNV